MAGFETLKYGADSANVFFCRIESNDSVLAVYGAEPTADATENMTVFNSQSRRGFGVHARGIIFKRTVGEDNNGGNVFAYVEDSQAYKFCAVGTPGAYNNQAHYPRGTILNFKGTDFEAVSRVGEKVA